jgi:site-specific DNA recombinase
MVICYALDRLSRDQYDTAILIALMQDAGARIAFVMEEFENTATGKFLLTAKAFGAELEREKIRERTSRGKAARVALGKDPAVGQPPYGYRWLGPGLRQKTQLVPDEATALIVQRIFRDIAAGLSTQNVAMALNAAGIPTATGRGAWIVPTIITIVRHPAYVGDLRINRWQTARVSGKQRTQRQPPPRSISSSRT